VRKSGGMNQNIEGRSTYHQILAEFAGLEESYVIHHSDNMLGGGSEIARLQRF